MKYKVLVTDPISDSGISILDKNNCEIIYKADNKDQIPEALPDIDAWIIRSGTKISTEDINLAKNYK